MVDFINIFTYFETFPAPTAETLLPLVCVVDEYTNFDIICNAGYDSVIYDPAPQPTGKRGRPARHGKLLSPDGDFTLSDAKVGEYQSNPYRWDMTLPYPQISVKMPQKTEKQL